MTDNTLNFIILFVPITILFFILLFAIIGTDYSNICDLGNCGCNGTVYYTECAFPTLHECQEPTGFFCNDSNGTTYKIGD
jgi:hypothetical protein